MDDNSELEEESDTLPLAFEREVPESISTHYSNHVLVTRGEYEYYLFFYEAEPPVIFGTPEQKKKQRENLKSVKAKCVSRVVVPNALMPKLLKAIERISKKPDLEDKIED